MDSKGLSYLSLRSIVKRIDGEDRILLSLCSPTLSSIEKIVPLDISKLKLGTSSIELDSMNIEIGEIRIVQNGETSERIREMNKYGGHLWETESDDVPEPGDLNMGRSDLPTHREELKQVERCRRIFMETLEAYLTSDTKKLFQEACLDLITFILDRGGPKGCLLLYDSYEPMDDCPDELGDQCPRARDNLIQKIRELDSSGNRSYEARMLRRIVYPQPDFSYHLLLTFNGKRGEYSVRLPEGLSHRQSFKRLTTRLFGGRGRVHVGELYIYPYPFGIIGLPVDMKIRINQLTWTSSDQIRRIWPIIDETYPMKRLTLFSLERASECVQVRQCKSLEFFLGPGAPYDELSNLFNDEIVIARIEGEWLKIIEKWSRSNMYRNIGSSCQIRITMAQFENPEFLNSIANSLPDGVPCTRDRIQFEGEKRDCLSIPIDDAKRMLIFVYEDSEADPEPWWLRLQICGRGQEIIE